IGGSSGNVYKNASIVVQQYFAILSLMGLVAITAFFNATATRDYTYKMDQIVFAAPIKKSHFFFGKFFGAFCIALIPYIGISLAAFLAPYMPWVEDPTRFGAFLPKAHIVGFFVFTFFNTLFGGAVIYAFAIYFRNPIVAYLSSFGLIICYIIASNLTKDLDNQNLAVIADPMGIRAFNFYTKYWSPAQRNSQYIGLEGALLVNRVLWASISTGILFLMYKLFDFTQQKTKSKSKIVNNQPKQQLYIIPKDLGKTNWINAWYLNFIFEFKSIIKNNSFIILTIIGLVNAATALFSISESYGGKSFLVTYNVVELVRGSMYIFNIAFILFYTGYIVFREREVKLNEIIDAAPISNSLVITSKMVAIIAALATIFLTCIGLGMLAQLNDGYTNFEIGVYLASFGIDLLGFSYLIVMGFLIHTLVNNKYLGYFVIVTFVILNSFLWQALKIESNLIIFGNLPSVTYSDMNGFGPFIPALTGFGIYWTIVSLILVQVIIGMALRGKETTLKARTYQLTIYIKNHKALVTSLLVLYAAAGAWLYYETKVVNNYISSKEQEELQISYEKKYKKYQNLLLPFTTSVNYDIAVFP
ncbi:MAG: hypothetical protein ACOVNR_07445, partial [Chitinophagaceae bacterium]